MFYETIKISDKIISVLTYMTGGFVGFIWLIYCSVAKKLINKFLLFNIYQSIFLGLLIFVINMLFGIVYNLMIMIPFVNRLANFLYFVIYTPVYYNWSIVGFILLGMYIYLMLFSFLGKIAYLPWVSNIILYQLNRF